MITFNRLLFCFIAILCFSIQSCKKDEPIPIDDGGLVAGKTVTASVSGVVKDESGNAVVGAFVKFNSNTTTTDQNGLFFFHNVNTSERSSTVIVSKSGFFNGSRTFFVKEGNRSTVKIRLLSKGTAQTFNTSSGGTVNFAAGLSITFQANSIVNKQTGAVYTGQVNVYAKMIDPTTNDGLESMPGDLRGINTEGEERLLQSFGMMVAELFDNSGNALQIASTSSASLSLTVPASLLANAPSSIPLWYFDEAKGTWIEEGSADLQGGKYVGEVKHFSFWNCDTPAAAIDLEMRLVDQNGNPLQNYTVKLTNTGNNDVREGWTDDNGWVGGLVYPNATLQMEVTSLSICGTQTIFHSQIVHTGSSNLNLGIIAINVTVSNPFSSTIIATIKDCDNNSVLNASLYLPTFGIFVTPDPNGNINHTLPCVIGNDIDVIVYDFDNNIFGVGTYSIQIGLNNLGSITACGSATPFMNLTVKNDVTLQEEVITSNFPLDSLSTFENLGEIAFYSTYKGQNIGCYLSFQVPGNSVGSFNISDGYFNKSISSTLPDDNFTFNSIGSVCTISSAPTIGNVEGNFVIHLIGSPSGQPYTVTGSFRVPKF